MLTPNERISNLEAQVVGLRAMFKIAGALPVNIVQVVLDQLVDDGYLPAETRTEIWGRVRQELRSYTIGSESLANGASAAIPRYRTKVERAAIHEREKQWSREILRLRSGTPDSDPKSD